MSKFFLAVLGQNAHVLPVLSAWTALKAQEQLPEPCAYVQGIENTETVPMLVTQVLQHRMEPPQHS